MTEPLTSPRAAAPAPLSMAERVGPIAHAVLRGAAKGLCYDQGGFQAAELWLLATTLAMITAQGGIVGRVAHLQQLQASLGVSND